MARCHAVEYIRLEHRVEAHARQLDVVVGEDVGVILQVMADFAPLRVFQEGLESCQHFVTIQLLRRAGVVVV